MTITYRVRNGSPLTWAQVDENFRYLDEGKVDARPGYALSQENFTATYKQILDGIPSNLDYRLTLAEDNASQAAEDASSANTKASIVLAPDEASKGPGAIPFDSQLDYQDGTVGAAIKDGDTVLRADLSGPDGSAEVGYGAGTVADVLQYVVVSPFIMNDSGITARIANRFALIAYLISGKKVDIPAGDLWVSSGIELPSGCNMEGAGRDLTRVIGDGNLFTISTAPSLQIRVANMTVKNDSVRGDLFANRATADSQGQLFENVYFGKSTCHFRSTAPALVHPRFKGCRFLDSTGYSRIFAGLWVYYEEDSYTWYCGGGVMHSSGPSNTCSVHGGAYEYNKLGAFDIVSIDGYSLGWTFEGVHFEGNGTADMGNPDVLLRTSTPQRIRAIVFINCGFYEPRASQPCRVLIDASGGGNISGVKFVGGSVVGSIPLTNNTASVTIDGTYIQSAAVGDLVLVTPAFQGRLSNSLGVLSLPGAEAGSSAVIASITLPAGTVFARISVRGNIQGGVAASSSAYLEATYNSAGNRITTLHDINNTVGANQGYIVAWNAGVVEVRNKASLSSTQSGNIIIEAFK
ncbi:hypothetical protein [Pseudomonas proteolytica]|uniref:hypothetical protein n=1 Tax=Pseudomonas proteolytica TaxID=219574 RepID=UPI0030EF73CA